MEKKNSREVDVPTENTRGIAYGVIAPNSHFSYSNPENFTFRLGEVDFTVLDGKTLRNQNWPLQDEKRYITHQLMFFKGISERIEEYLRLLNLVPDEEKK